jgi:EAL domain-containing protein (putative c-di-GMP-specific phosphodiesterase class I)
MSISASDIQGALERDQFVFYYQPKVSFLTGRISGAEALIRWRRDDGQVVQPTAFMPLAEGNGLTPRITRQMFPKLVEDFQKIRAGSRQEGLAFNISAEDLDAPNLVTLVRQAISEGRLSADRLELEITESTAISENDVINRSLTGLLAAGVDLCMDDYGIGFSSLATLNRVPFSVLKMDQSFVMRMMRSPKSATLVKTSIAMAQLLGIKTVVEGIESERVYSALLHYGCTEGQGYWISRPLPLAEYLDLLSQDRRWPSSPIGMLRMAEMSHNWQYKLLMDVVFEFLKRGQSGAAAPELLHTSHDACALGEWYYGAGQALAGEPDFECLEAPHRLMHEICGRIFDAMQANAGAKVLHPLLHDLSSQSCKMSGCLHSLEAHLLLRELE